MTVWTLSMEEGTGGEEIAATLAAAADAPLIDREAEAAIAQVLSWHPDDVDQLEHHLPGPLYQIAIASRQPRATRLPDESRINVPAVRETTERVFREAARWPCVLLGRAGFRIVADHPGALHVRLRAPFEWRVSNHARAHLITAGGGCRRDPEGGSRPRDLCEAPLRHTSRRSRQLPPRHRCEPARSRHRRSRAPRGGRTSDPGLGRPGRGHTPYDRWRWSHVSEDVPSRSTAGRSDRRRC